jgi:hypothetical protein
MIPIRMHVNTIELRPLYDDEKEVTIQIINEKLNEINYFKILVLNDGLLCIKIPKTFKVEYLEEVD